MGVLEEFSDRIIKQLNSINARLDRLEKRAEYNTDISMLTVKEVAEEMSSSTAHIYRLMREFDLPYVRAGKSKKLIPRSKLIKWIEDNTIECYEDTLDKLKD